MRFYNQLVDGQIFAYCDASCIRGWTTIIALNWRITRTKFIVNSTVLLNVSLSNYFWSGISAAKYHGSKIDVISSVLPDTG